MQVAELPTGSGEHRACWNCGGMGTALLKMFAFTSNIWLIPCFLTHQVQQPNEQFNHLIRARFLAGRISGKIQCL